MNRKVRYLRRNHESWAPAMHLVCTANYMYPGHRLGNDVRLACADEVYVTPIRRSENGFDAGETIGGKFDPRFWDTIRLNCSKKHATWMWVFKAGEFIQGTSLVEEIERGGFNLRWHVWESRPHLTALECERGRVVILDVRNWLNVDFGGMVKLVALNSANEEALLDKDKLQNPTLTAMHFSLCLAVGGILEFHHLYDLGNLKLTVGAQALAFYRHKHAKMWRLDEHCVLRKDMSVIKDADRCYPIPHSDENALTLEKDAVAGGVFRQCYRGRVEGPIHIVDIQSAYSAAMVEWPMPAKLLGCADRPSLRAAETIALEYPCVAWVKITTNESEYPVRLKQDELEGRREPCGYCFGEGEYEYNPAIMASGRYWTTLAGPELLVAFQRQEVEQVERMYYYATADMFSSYVQCLWELRKNMAYIGNALHEKLCKEMLAALWGKFSQCNPRWIKNTDIECIERWGLFNGEDPVTGWYGLCRGVAGKTEMRVDLELASHAFPALAATVCSAVRRKLYSLVDIAGIGNVYYTAGDCLHVNELGFTNLDNSNNIRQGVLGHLKHKDTIPWAYYHSPLAWWTQDFRKISGVTQDAKEIAPGKWEFWESAPASSWIYDGPHVGCYQRRVIVDTSDWRPRGSFNEGGWVNGFNVDLCK